MQKLIFTTLLLSLFFACKPTGQPEDSGAAIPSGGKDSVSLFYPFPQFITDQLAWLDSMPLAVEQITDIDGQRVDSLYIDKSAFRAAALDLISIDPNRQEYKGAFSEDSFEDLTLNTITFTITANDSSLPLQRADILLHPETRKVKNLLLQRQLVRGDSTEIQHVIWATNMKCQVSSEIQRKNGNRYRKVVNYIWDRPIK